MTHADKISAARIAYGKFGKFAAELRFRATISRQLKMPVTAARFEAVAQWCDSQADATLTDLEENGGDLHEPKVSEAKS